MKRLSLTTKIIIGLVLGIALLMFGPKKLPELGKGLGEGIRKFKSSLREMDGSAEPTSEAEAPKPVSERP